MKKIFLFCLTTLILIFSYPPVSFAQKSVEYELPYPGILPGNFFYFFKTSRDTVFDFFIKDPIKKAEFNIERADKNLKAAIIVSEKGDFNQEMAEEVIAKSQGFYEEALEKLEQADSQNSEVSSLVLKLKKSLLKQEEVIKGLIKDSNGETTLKLEKDLKTVQNLIKSADQVFPHN